MKNKHLHREVNKLAERITNLENKSAKKRQPQKLFFSQILSKFRENWELFKAHAITFTFVFQLSISVLVLIEIAKKYSGFELTPETSLLITIISAGFLATSVAFISVRKIENYKHAGKVLFKEKKTLEEELINSRLQFENKVQERTNELAEINDLLNEEIEVRKQTEEALKRSERKYRLLYRYSPIGIFHYDKNLVVNDFNDKFSTILKAKREELIKFNFKNVNDSQIITALTDGLNGKVGKYEGALNISDYNNTVSLITAPFYNQYRDILGGVGIIEDINERKQSENMLVLAKERAEQSDKMKSEFVAQISHEIRTPIHIIQSFSDLLKQELSPEIKEDLRTAVNIISDAGSRITRTLGQIINIAELQSGDYKAEPKKIEMYKDVLLGVYSNYKARAEIKALAFTLAKNTNQTLITADEFSIHQIFCNLVDNAIKYTPAGSVKIEIYSPETNHLSIKVSDTGVGISEEYLPHLFTPFSQEERGYSRMYEGNGLGMALVKKYCELNNGIISVHSKKNEGSSFVVTFIS